MSYSMIGVFQEVNKRRQNEKMQITPLVVFAEAWDHQQKKIDAVLKFLDGYDAVDIENSVALMDCINEIKELLK